MKSLSNLKICMLTHAWTPWWGGGQTHIWEVSKILVEKFNCDIDIIVPNLINSQQPAFPQIETSLNNKLKVIRIGKPFVFPNFFGRISFIVSCAKFIFKNNYDLYHSHTYDTSIFLPLLKMLKNKKIIFTLHGAGEVALGAGFLNKLAIPKLIADTTTYAYKYDALITVAKKSLVKKTNTTTVYVIGNGVNLQDFEKIPENKSRKSFIFLWVGRFVTVKGLPVLISAAEELVKTYPGLLFKLIGDGDEKETIKKIIKNKHLEKCIMVENAKYGKDLIKEYKSANAFVLPSISGEGFPITIAEALAARLPVIASDIGDTGVLVQNNKTGYLTIPGSISDLKQKIIQLLENSKRESLGLNGHDLVVNNYTWDKIASQIYNVYCQVLNI